MLCVSVLMPRAILWSIDAVRCLLLASIAVLGLAPRALATDYYIAPSGTAFGSGTKASPLSFHCVWTNTCSSVTITSADDIWGLGGTYDLALSATINSSLQGTASDPLILRCYPGEVCALDANQQPGSSAPVVTLSATARYVWFWGWRMYNSNPERMQKESGSSPSGERGGTLFMFAPDSRVIDLYAHDVQNGIGFWRQAERSWIDTAFVMHAGWSAPDRGHGHCFYVQNDVPTKVIYNAMGMRCFGNGFNVFGTNAPVNNMLFRHISSTEQGILGAAFEAQINRNPNFLHRTGFGPAHDVEVDGGIFYRRSDVRSEGITSGLANIDGAENFTVRNSYMAGGRGSLSFAGYNNAEIVDNTIVVTDFTLEADFAVSIDPSSTASASDFVMARNTYYSNANTEPCPPTNQCNWIFDNGPRLSFAQWQGLGFDASSVEFLSLPPAPIVQISPSEHDRAVGYVKILDLTGASTVSVDLSPILRVGDSYAVYDAQHLFVSPTDNAKSTPLVAGQWDGEAVDLPVELTTVTPAVGDIYRVDRSPLGTITCAGTSCTGSGTAFLAEVAVGDLVWVNPREAEVAAVTSDSALTLVSAFAVDPVDRGFDIVKMAVPVTAEHTVDEINYYRVERLPDTGARVELGDDEVLVTAPCVTGLSAPDGELRLFFDPLRQEAVGSPVALTGIERQRTVEFSGLTASTTYYYWTDCGIQSLGSFTTRPAQVGSADVKIELSAGPAGADDVVIDWGYASIAENSVTSTCVGGCTVTLPGVDVGRVFRYRFTRRDAVDAVLSVSREHLTIQ